MPPPAAFGAFQHHHQSSHFSLVISRALLHYIKSTIFLISEKNRIAVDVFKKKYFYIVLLCSFGGETFLEEIGVKVTCTVGSRRGGGGDGSREDLED